MQSKSKSQQRFFGMVDAYKKGEMPDASQEIKDAAKGMTKKEVKDLASTKHKGLPNHVKKGKKKSVKLSEEELCRVINESIGRTLREGFGGSSQRSGYWNTGDVNPRVLDDYTTDVRNDMITDCRNHIEKACEMIKNAALGGNYHQVEVYANELATCAKLINGWK